MPPAVIICRLSFSYRLAHVIFATAQLGVADHLGAGPRSVADLSTRVEADPRALRRFLRVLLALGVVREVAPDQFGLTPLVIPLGSAAISIVEALPA
jgi:DNA-binding IclR family transcriptional regulator